MKTRIFDLALLMFVLTATTALFSCGGADMDDNPEPAVDPANGHEYVDLGLSVKWATCNVGANKPWEYGNYFAWGETSPKNDYSWGSYKWYDNTNNCQTKYKTTAGTVLEPSDDAAHINWGGAWRMPTIAEMEELLNTENCKWEWTTQNGVNGYKVTSLKEGYTNNSIFLPAAGYRRDTGLYGTGSYGYYWSASLYMNHSDYAQFLYSDSQSVGSVWNPRCIGRSVRPILP